VVVLLIWTTAAKFFPKVVSPISPTTQQVKVVSEESAVVDVVKNVGPSAVTVIEKQTVNPGTTFNFGPFGFYQQPSPSANGEEQTTGTGSGFVISDNGLIVTNKHVVSDVGVKYQVITSDNVTYTVKKVYRDPLNDIAFIQIDLAENSGHKLKPVIMGDSSRLQVGQLAIAIGTALGEFKNTVTTGVISGLGRGITAGSNFEGFVEKLDNVIQTDAAINLGNSGGPLVNSAGQVIGMNTAVSQSGQNIGFALPINLVKESLSNFSQNGKFSRPFLGVSYRMLDKQAAQANDLVEGAYVQSVVDGSPAALAGVQTRDVVISFDGKNVSEDNELSTLIGSHKVGDNVAIIVWRDGKKVNLSIKLGEAPQE
jgi:serine protease Do